MDSYFDSNSIFRFDFGVGNFLRHRCHHREPCGHRSAARRLCPGQLDDVCQHCHGLQFLKYWIWGLKQPLTPFKCRLTGLRELLAILETFSAFWNSTFSDGLPKRNEMFGKPKIWSRLILLLRMQTTRSPFSSWSAIPHSLLLYWCFAVLISVFIFLYTVTCFLLFGIPMSLERGSCSLQCTLVAAGQWLFIRQWLGEL